MQHFRRRSLTRIARMYDENQMKLSSPGVVLMGDGNIERTGSYGYVRFDEHAPPYRQVDGIHV